MNLKTKNIVFLTHSYRVFIKDQIEEISKYFNHVYVFVRYKPIVEIPALLNISDFNAHIKKNAFDFTNKPNNVEIIPVPIYYLPYDWFYKRLGNWHFQGVDKIIKKKKIKFDIVHAHFTWSSGYVGSKLKEKYNVPFVITCHGYDIYNLPFKDKEWRKKIKHVLNSADQIITVSNNNLKYIKKLNIKTSAKVINNGFNSGLFYPKEKERCRKKLNLPLNKKIVLSVGNLEEVKNHEFLIKAFNTIKNTNNDIICIIVGSGKLKRQLQNLINSNHLNNNVFLKGLRPHHEIINWINASDIFVLPSLNEGGPTVMFESLACGIPFIGTNVGGISQIVSSKEYGLIIKKADNDILAYNITKALAKKWNKNKIIKYAKLFTWEKMAKKIILEYQRIVKTK